MLIRLIGVIMIILGLLFWTGNALTLIPVHMLLGLLLVLLLWALSFLGVRAGMQIGFVALVIVWSLILPALGMTQNQLLPGTWHWIIQVLHLLVGVGALGIAERLAGRIKSAERPAGNMSPAR
jgi:hypothetical protein